MYSSRYDSRCISISPARIRYAHDSVSSCFKDGRELEHMFRELLEHPQRLHRIPKIIVMEKDGSYWAVEGNRRLVVFKMLQEVGELRSGVIEVELVPFNQHYFENTYSTNSNGLNIKIRGFRGDAFQDKLREIWRHRWQNLHAREAARKKQDGVTVGQFIKWCCIAIAGFVAFVVLMAVLAEIYLRSQANKQFHY